MQFLDLETTLASPSDENLTILTELSSLQLSNVVGFASKGVLPILNENEPDLAAEFLSFGIDLSRFNLVPDVEKSASLDWPEDDYIDTKPLLPIVIKTEDIGWGLDTVMVTHVLTSNCSPLKQLPCFSPKLHRNNDLIK